jgi:uncharacterized protein (DUF2062 family)
MIMPRAPLPPVRRPWRARVLRRSVAGALRLFRLRESRERVARGFALGLVINFLPTFGAGVLISGFVARALGGNLVAGIIGGASLTFAWPLLFYFNMRVGSLLVQPRRAIEHFGDVTVEAMTTLAWGWTFMVGALVNLLVAGFAAYGAMYLLYGPFRPHAVRGLRRAATRLNRRRSPSDAR